MSQHLKAVYEHGVFRPLFLVRLLENQEVTLVLDTTEDQEVAGEDEPICEVAEDPIRNVPQGVLDRAPLDGAAQHDRYLYAAPKRD